MKIIHEAKMILGILVVSAVLGGCASLRSVSVTRVPADRSKPISAEAWTWGILGLYGSNDFVNEAVQSFDGKCPKGRISGILTKYSNRFYFLWTTRTVTLTGYCLAENSK